MTFPFRICASATQTRKPTLTFAHGSLLQRKCACGSPGSESECDDCRRKNDGNLQRCGASLSGPRSAPPIVNEVLRSPGKQLTTTTRTFMEPLFGHDFGQVRIHTDSRAAESANAVNALAYTVGENIVFGRNSYETETVSGRRLLAHELTHVIQQRAQPATPRLDRQADDGSGSDESEQQASLAELVILGEPQDMPNGPAAYETPNPDADPLGVGSAACPVSETFLVMQVGAAKANCQVPNGLFGPTPHLAHFRIRGVPANSPVAGLTISEQFTVLEDPFGIAGVLQPQSDITDQRGEFDDCFMIAAKKNQLPAGFRLKVEQNHLLNGAIIGKNHITYTDSQILFCHFDRLPNSCDFGKRCKL